MASEPILFGKSRLYPTSGKVTGSIVTMNGEKYYKIENYDLMPDFFISMNSSSNQWMFISSNGSLSAGRRNRDNALFPYYTEDKIHDYQGITGSSSFFIVTRQKEAFLWEPFSPSYYPVYQTKRNIYKSIYGNKIVFEETNLCLNAVFRYSWTNSETYGFVRKSELENNNEEEISIRILDGIRNIIPSGTNYVFQNEYSNLLDAYKKNELLRESNTGLYTLSSVPVDRAEPSESLTANTVFCLGIRNPKILLSDKQIPFFRKNLEIKTEKDIRARRGAYLMNSDTILSGKERMDWLIIAEVNQDGAQISDLNKEILSNKQLADAILMDVNMGTEKLKKVASTADGLQKTHSVLHSTRHFSNAIYNLMRGGTFTNNYTIITKDFINYLQDINKTIYTQFISWSQNLPQTISRNDLLKKAEKTQHSDLLRITMEYLPLSFSRRHGDPSRPWNRFSIETKNPDGSLKFNYEGNWRDIFQNWEALSYSFPEFAEGMITKFLNATTADGYNPYRITRKGIDWECPDPDDPWAYIGYWGDHQIIYLQKLLELYKAFYPDKMEKMLDKEFFTFANVPYQIKHYSDILKDPQNTILFNHELNTRIEEKTKITGGDGKLLSFQNSDEIVKVGMMEKVFLTLLSKLSNFIPEAGIWLNTQRPEWNDANNALVGNGTSMVTLYYLRRFMSFWKTQLQNSNKKNFSFSVETIELFNDLSEVFENYKKYCSEGFSDHTRKEFTDQAGLAHDRFRYKIYKNSFEGKHYKIENTDLQKFLETAIEYANQSIRTNKRNDGLYHSYNLISVHENEIRIRYLYEMLEGQVAVLSSGHLSATESIKVLKALRRSKIYREDQNSYMLYPDRQLKLFMEKNRVPSLAVEKSFLLGLLVKNGDKSIISKDSSNNYYFNHGLRNAELLNAALSKLEGDEYKSLLAVERSQIREIYESVFDHQSFTGRSGTFYGYEGLGSIYWHMVSKLLLAIQETFFSAVDDRADKSIIHQLKAFYYEVKEGIGVNKSPNQYGAFPVDAYSHTPGGAGVKQPGLTGQVKEDIITRFGELGVRVENGKISFDSSLLLNSEFLENPDIYEAYTIQNKPLTIPLAANQLGLTICQVPVIIEKSSENFIHIELSDQEKIRIQGNSLSEELSQHIFKRDGRVQKVQVYLHTPSN